MIDSSPSTFALALFWGSLAVLVYTYLGYGALTWALGRVRRFLTNRRKHRTPAAPASGASDRDDALPAVTLIVAAYNEADVLDAKLDNLRALDYPEEKLEVLFVTDGSTDGSPERLAREPGVQCLHQPARAGKAAAMNRGVAHATTPVVAFTDANAMLALSALRALIRPYRDPSVGAVAGEKQVENAGGDAAGAGEGLYWTYESALRRWDADLHTIVGAAGELFSVRTDLYRPLPTDTILDDFVATLTVAGSGYRVAYAPEATAREAPSASLSDEMTRKVRIAAGGIQSIARLRHLLNPLRDPLLAFQLGSHRVLRWTLAPAMLPVCLASNIALAAGSGAALLYEGLLAAHVVFYGLACVYGAVAAWDERAAGRFPGWLSAPFYFVLMNAAVYAGAIRYVRGGQSAQWKRVRRAESAGA